MTRCCTHACNQGRDCPRHLWAQSTPRRSYDDRDGMSVLTLAVLCVFGLFCWTGLALLLIGGV